MIRLATLTLLATTSLARAAPGPQPDPMPPPTPSPRRPLRRHPEHRRRRDRPHRHIFTVHETIPVHGAGDTVLLYPQWIPGNHGPTGPLELFDGLTVRAGAQTLAWRRDPVNMYAFHIPVPAGATSITADYQYLSPRPERSGQGGS